MNKLKLKIIAMILTVFVTMPIWYFLLYRILTAVGATELMWFLYWVYIPVAIVSMIIAKIVEGE
jgi:hypothetical protein